MAYGTRTDELYSKLEESNQEHGVKRKNPKKFSCSDGEVTDGAEAIGIQQALVSSKRNRKHKNVNNSDHKVNESWKTTSTRFNRSRSQVPRNTSCHDTLCTGLIQRENNASTNPIQRRERSHSVQNKLPKATNQNRKQFHQENTNKAEKQSSSKLQSYMFLNNLSNMDDTDILAILKAERNDFKGFLKSSLRPDQIVLLMKLLAKVSESQFPSIKASILSLACQKDFLEKIGHHLYNMPTDTSKERKSSMKDFLSNLLLFSEQVLKLFRSTASEYFKDLFIKTDLTIGGIETYQGIDLSEVKVKFTDLQKILNEMVLEHKKEVIKIRSEVELEQYQPPPDNFRDRNVFPTTEDILSNEPIVLRHNIIKGAYLDVEHYLDVQFRLLQEDFMDPLREGIKTYIMQMKSKENKHQRIDNIRIYYNVTFGNPKIINNDIGITVNFDPNKRFQKINWEYAKRFMYGSLLCFTNDGFKTLVFATVAEKSVRDLQEGRFCAIILNEDVPKGFFTSSCVMVESEVYFEPYKLVLQALQGMSSYTFPMENFIIFVSKEISAPDYLRKLQTHEYTIDNYVFELFDGDAWPSCQELKLDEAQYKAFQTALTKEFVIIQGPPGTGKTFLGLKLVQVLLDNGKYWYNKTPILVVCYTNHALDQFLEGILQYTKHIIRVGGQSKTETLNPYNIKEKRKHYHRSCYREMNYDQKFEVDKLLRDMKRIQKNLEVIEMQNGIIDLKILRDYGVILEKHFKTLTFRKDRFLDWLVNSLIMNGMKWISLPQRNPRVQPIDQFNVGGVAGSADINTDMLENVIREEKRYDIMDEDFEDYENVNSDISYCFDLEHILKTQESYQCSINQLSREAENNYEVQFKLEEFYYNYEILEQTKNFVENSLKNNYEEYYNQFDQLQTVNNLWGLSAEKRWILYECWVNKLKNKLWKRMEELKVDFEIAKKHFEEGKLMADAEVLRQALVVGMTTSGAARYQPVLQGLKPKIVIVEEAAEVLEAHIVVSLTNKCEHLILIGDHKQLRPSTSVYKLAREYNFDVSLFERMINNGLEFCTLQKQHRMRPEISKLIVPAIYPELKDDLSVLNYPPVIGLKKSLFFMNHTFLEQEDNERSHKNVYEADFLLHLCRHLILQGYTSEEITILTTYRGQMFYMLQEKKKMPLINGVKITVVDNFQGEENRIILLSLVRSNTKRKIGFLKIENRVNVALSRAKEGLYILGNMENLESSSKIWPKIKESLDSQGSYGSYLTLQCKIHPDQETHVSKAEDFTKMLEGGCSLLCESLLPCGHQCTSICHVTDREHKKYKCFQKCERVPVNCAFAHPCPKHCHEDCGNCGVLVKRVLPCEHQKVLKCYVDHLKYSCKEELKVKLPECDHETTKYCFQKITDITCPHPCENRLECGHSCILTCHIVKDPDHLEYKCKKPCTRINKNCSENHICSKSCSEECGNCEYEVPKKLPCGHTRKMICSMDVASVQCRIKCPKMLSCGHRCPRRCFESCGGCPVMVEKVIPVCGHKIKVKCCQEPDPSECKHDCERKLKCGHKCTELCGSSCTDKCSELSPNLVLSACGHKVAIPCYMQIEKYYNTEKFLKYCKEPCKQTLVCEHPCKGTCGKCLQGRIHIPCAEKCERSLICGHKCRVPCSRACPPCISKCLYKCKHSKCAKKCGMPCSPCQEKCDWRCKHKRCAKLCSELCDRDPCSQPCEKSIEKCGHPCIGFCGDPCPPLCRICDKDEVTEIFFGTEDEDEARFVYLVDCKHTLEAEGLKQWMENKDKEIGMKICPRCKTPIMHTERFMNYVKQAYVHIGEVKNRVFGRMPNIEKYRTELLQKINILDDIMIHSSSSPIQESMKYRSIIGGLRNQLMPVKGKRRNHLSSHDLDIIRTRIDILTNLSDSLKNLEFLEYRVLPDNKFIKHYEFLLCELWEQHRTMSIQEAADFTRECNRFERMTQLAFLKLSGKLVHTKAEIMKLDQKIHDCLYSCHIYNEECDTGIRRDLKTLNELLKASLVISDKEKKEIVRAMGVAQGQWFKCPNGHIYLIGDCGGAMETSVCPECKSAIGGTQHRLLASNRFAPEMDGAERPAWPGTLH